MSVYRLVCISLLSKSFQFYLGGYEASQAKAQGRGYFGLAVQHEQLTTFQIIAPICQFYSNCLSKVYQLEIIGLPIPHNHIPQHHKTITYTENTVNKSLLFLSSSKQYLSTIFKPRYHAFNNITNMQNTKTFVLSANDQAKITNLFTNFAKSEPNLLKYSEVIMLLIDRCVFNTKFTFTDFHPLFEAALKVKAVKPNDKIEVQGQRVIAKQQLIFLLNQTAYILYKPDPNYLERFYQMLLSQKMQVENGEINRARVMVIDDLSKKLIVQDVMKQLCLYSQQIKHLFISYQVQNYWSIKRKRRLLLTFREILLQNKKWSYVSLILFLKQSQTTPHLITVEHIEEFLRMLIPNINAKQQEFYSRRVISEAYHKDVDGGDGVGHPGDPGIMLFQLQILIIRLAWDTFPKQQEKKDIRMILQRYLKYLYFRKNEELSTMQLPNINRKMINKMKEYYKVINNQITNEEGQKKLAEDKLTPFQKLAKKMEKDLTNAPTLNIDFQQLLKGLERQLPKMPPLPKVEPEYTGKYDKNFAVTLGRQPPPEPVQKDQKGGGKAEKKDAGKKDQIPPRQFKWAQVPQVKLTTQDYLKDIQDKLNFEVKPLGDISRGTINNEGYPALIGQILFPPELPKSVVPYLQAANNALLDRNFILALENFNNGASSWKKSSVEFDAVAELFFQYSKGNIYLAAGKLDYALQAFLQSKKAVEGSKLPFTNPDRSLPYYGIGEVFYEMQEYELAARSFLKSREIRQSVLGLEHVQTASVFNNLGCCFFMLRRSQQALGYIEIAEVVLDTQLGPHHQRTMTSRYNLKKITRGTFQNKPAFRKFWQVFEEDLFEKKKKKKKDDGGKKDKK